MINGEILSVLSIFYLDIFNVHLLRYFIPFEWFLIVLGKILKVKDYEQEIDHRLSGS